MLNGTFWAITQVSTQSIYICREEKRCQETMKYKGDLSIKLLFLKNHENALTTFLHSTDELLFRALATLTVTGGQEFQFPHFFPFSYKCILGCAPLYLQELFQMYKPTRNLRFSSKQLLVQTSSSTKTYGLRAFQHSSAELWNKLPNHIKNAKTLVQFKKSFKT